MNHETCPRCGEKFCPAVGPHRFLCTRCGSEFVRYPTSFESQVKAVGAAFRLGLAKILKD